MAQKRQYLQARWALTLSWLGTSLALGCGGRADVLDLLANAANGSSTTPSASGGAAGSSATGVTTHAPSTPDANCTPGRTACTNCVDDDGDGLSDARDPECTGPLDDDEATFATGIPGDNRDFCQDCFFDGNSGHGDDGCQYHTECLYGRQPRAAGGSACFQCEVSDTCRKSCVDFTPNGCDCFGCCEVFDSAGESRHVRLTETCRADLLGDDQACEACVPSTQCYNDCGPCEVCMGRPGPGPDCASEPPAPGAPPPAPESPPPASCPEGRPACEINGECAPGQYCLTGCCIDSPVIH